MKSVDGKIKDVSPEEAKKKAEPEEQPEAQPESQSDNATDVEELKRSLRRYYFAKDPEEASKNIKAAVGAVAGAFTWMMKAENQKGGEAIDIMFSKIKDKYKEMEEKIKTGKVKANEINKLVADNAILFQKLIRTYRETKVAARKEFGNDDEFNKESARLRKSFANNNKELSDKSTKAMESAEVSGLRYVFKTLLKESSFSSHHQTLKKIMAKSDKLKDSKKILDSYIDEMVKAGINMQSIREFMNDDDVAKLLKNFLKKKTP